MAKKKGFSSLIRFQHRFNTEQACIEYLASKTWPTGYKCKKCGGSKAYQLRGRNRVFMCRHCNSQESVTSGTVMHRTRLPLMIWFWAAYLLSQDKRGVSAMHLKRELDLHYSTAWTLLHKLRRTLADSQEPTLKGVVEVDETYYGGKGCKDSKGRSLSNKNKSLIVMAVERKPARGNKAPGINDSGFVCGNAAVAVAASASSEDLSPFIGSALKAGSNMLTDGWKGYGSNSQQIEHEPETQGNPKNAGILFPMVHVQFSNLKSWLNGTFHGVSKKHLPGYLMEFNYRFNRRNLISNLFGYVIRRLMNTEPITCEQVKMGFNFVGA